jgi:dihydrofolate reductase
MARLIQWNLISLDGYFEGSRKWDLEWHKYVWDQELETYSVEQLRSAGMLLFGRITYEGMAAYSHEQRAKGRRLTDPGRGGLE